MVARVQGDVRVQPVVVADLDEPHHRWTPQTIEGGQQEIQRRHCEVEGDPREDQRKTVAEDGIWLCERLGVAFVKDNSESLHQSEAAIPETSEPVAVSEVNGEKNLEDELLDERLNHDDTAIVAFSGITPDCLSNIVRKSPPIVV